MRLTNRQIAANCPIISPFEVNEFAEYVRIYSAAKNESFLWKIWIKSQTPETRKKHVLFKIFVKASLTDNEDFRANLKHVWRMAARIVNAAPLAAVCK